MAVQDQAVQVDLVLGPAVVVDLAEVDLVVAEIIDANVQTKFYLFVTFSVSVIICTSVLLNREQLLAAKVSK